MKKLNLTSQLLLLFFCILLIASGAFSIIILTRVQSIAEQEVYSRLSSYIYLINSHSSEDLPDMNVGYYIRQIDTELDYESPTLQKYINDEELNELISALQEKNKGKNPLTRGNIKNGNNKIYYVVYYSDTFHKYTIVFTNSDYVKNMVKSVSAQVILLFLIVMLISIFVIYLYSTRIAKRIQKIQNHILHLPSNKYEIQYIDPAEDEIGELSQSIEQLRKTIGENERTKQEMLQNLSHDFKTPIAVIKSYAEAQQDGIVANEESSKIIISQADILKKKVNRLLQYNSLEYLKRDREFENVDMKEIILEVIQAYKFQTDIHFELDLNDDIYFLGYRENLYTIIDNIVDNAKRYAKTKIKIVLRKDRIRIYNDGDPIDEQFLNGLFKPYEKGSKGEFGLGLSIVKKTIDFFGLELKVVNEAVGVSFIILNTQEKA